MYGDLADYICEDIMLYAEDGYKKTVTDKSITIEIG